MAANHENHGLLLAAAILLLPLFLLAKLRRRRKKYGGVPLKLNPPPGPWQLPVIGSMHHLVGALPHRAMRDLALRHGPLMLLRMGELPVVVASSAAAAREVLKTHDAAFATRPRTNTIATLAGDGLGFALAPRPQALRHGAARRAAGPVVPGDARGRGGRPRRVRGRRRGVRGRRERQLPRQRVRRRRRGARHCRRPDRGPRRLPGVPGGGPQVVLRLQPRRPVPVVAPRARAQQEVAPGRGGSPGDVQGHGRRHQGETREEGGRQWHRQGGRGGHPGRASGRRRHRAPRHRDRPCRGEGSLRGRERVLGVDAAVGHGGAAAEAGGAPEGAGGGARRARRAEPRPGGGPAGASLPAAGDQGDAPAARDGARVLGYDVPQGTMVLVNAWAIGRDAATFGADAEEFRPERFEEGAAAALDFRGTDFELLPFGAGRRMCPGIAFGLAVMELALASLLFHFDWELPGGTVELDMAETFGVTAKMKNDLWLRATVVVPPL
ncbi:hypothetical protein ACQJBY_039750 [Aegilops geniculata]